MMKYIFPTRNNQYGQAQGQMQQEILLGFKPRTIYESKTLAITISNIGNSCWLKQVPGQNKEA